MLTVVERATVHDHAACASTDLSGSLIDVHFMACMREFDRCREAGPAGSDNRHPAHPNVQVFQANQSFRIGVRLIR